MRLALVKCDVNFKLFMYVESVLIVVQSDLVVSQ